MIVHNMTPYTDPEDVRLLVNYVSSVFEYNMPKFNRAKRWHDHIFRPRYYYTSCARTLELISQVNTSEMARHVIYLESIAPRPVEYFVEVQSIVERLMNAGLYVVLHKDTPYVLRTSHDIFKGGYIEVVMEGTPFEQEYVTDFKGFHTWLDKRLPRPSLVR